MDLQLVANTIRGLTMDAVQKANSGHPGMPMGTADFATVLFLKVLKHNPADPQWPDRDRFVLSPGHGSMLIYSLLHLSGYDLSMEDLKQFRQFGSRTPGHPEVGLTPGVETSTGPLGQGCGNAVGMALAEAMLAEKFNREGFPLVDHRTYAIVSDGDLMEGVSHEAFALAGHLGLHKLIAFYDCNRITIEGSTDLAYSDDVRRRFEAYNWNVLEIDGHDFAACEQALETARKETNRPTIIIGHTHIAHGSPNAHDTAGSHGAPLGHDEIRATKRNLGLPEDQDFFVPPGVYELFAARRQEMEAEANRWKQMLAEYRRAQPELATEWDIHQTRQLPSDWEKVLPSFDPAKPLATRQASGTTLQALARAIPQLVGGSADLAPSTNTLLKGMDSVGPRSFAGRNFHFGIREHGMAAILNGMALHGGWIVFGATFFTFADYCRPSVRMAAIMQIPVIFVFTHDSIFVGEDGPTHQPVEQLASLRAIPGLSVIRPADATETAVAWQAAITNTKGPTALILTRQTLPTLDRSQYPSAQELLRGGYVLAQSGEGEPELLIIATGSEVSLALAAMQELGQEGKNVRVVSLPSWDLFEAQPESYRDTVIPPACTRRIVIEAGSPLGWARYAGPTGIKLCIANRFGASGPWKVLAEEYGFTTAHVVATARKLFEK